MLEFISEPANSVFIIALLVMFGIALLEGVFILLGFGLFQFLDTLLPEVDLNVDVDVSSNIEPPGALSRFFSWLRIGKVPLLMLLVVFLTSFGLIGLILQSLVQSVVGYLLPAWLASIPAILFTLPIVSIVGEILEKIMPNDETEAISNDSLIGRIATITLGVAKKNYPAEARVLDQFGATHYIMVEPDKEGETLNSGSDILLLKYEGTKFIAIYNPNASLTD